MKKCFLVYYIAKPVLCKSVRSDWSKAGKFKICNQNSEKILSFFTAKLPEKAKGITESQEGINDFINQQKSANTNKETATDMNTLLGCIEANAMKNEKIEILPASELDHFLSKFV